MLSTQKLTFNKQRPLKANSIHDIRRIFLLSQVILGLMLFVLSCNPRDRVPSEFPNRDEMAQILADLYLSENIMNNSTQGGNAQLKSDLFPGYYKDVMEKYNLSTEKFDAIRKWYAAHPYHFQEVYDKAIVILSQREAEIKQQIADERERKKSLTKDLWEGPREYTTSDSLETDHRLPFSISLDSLQAGTIRLVAFYKLSKEDMTRKARIVMMMHYSDSTIDTVTYQLPLSFKKKAASLSYSLDSTKTGLSVSGFLFDHDTLEVASAEVSDVRLHHFSGSDELIKPEDDEDL